MPVAIVTGASQGIGRAIALRLASDGFDVAINDLSSQEPQLLSLQSEIQGAGRQAIVVTGDVSKETHVSDLVNQTVASFSQLDVMVANAGAMLMRGLMELSTEDLDRVLSVNVRGVFLCYQKAAERMIARGKGGRIIGAGSISGYRPQPAALAYGVSKWAVRGLTQASALELAPHGITVNAYCPGIVKTPMWDTIDEDISKKMGVPLGTAWDMAVSERPAMKKPSTPEDVAGCVSFLASKDANLITGQSIIIDGGIVFS